MQPEVPSPADESASQLADHVEESVDAIAALHQEHYRSASPLQRILAGITDRLGRPSLVALMIVGVAGWIVGTLLMTGRGVDQPSFGWLELAATITALVVAMLILATQREQDKLAERRVKLTLELAILGDRKNAKIIALLEELRRDQPGVTNRTDRESAEMAKPTNPAAVLAALDERADPRSRPD